MEPLDTMRPVGMYPIEYAGGTRADVPLVYGVNITAWSDTKHLNVLHPLVGTAGGGRLHAGPNASRRMFGG